MSYRAIIVDDEIKIAKLIYALGKWDELRIEVVDMCCSGRQAYESIIKNRPDFVLSDIKMPEFDGLELIRMVRAQGLNPQFVLISGYRHFDYARSAVSLNVMEYLLKPVNEDQLNETLERVCRRIDQQRCQEADTESANQVRLQKEKEKINGFFRDLMGVDDHMGGLVFADEERCNRQYGTGFAKGCYQVLSLFSMLGEILGDNGDENLERCIRKSFHAGRRLYYLNTYRGVIIVLNFSQEEKKTVRKEIETLFYSLLDLGEVYGQFRLSMGVSNVKSLIRELRDAFQEAYAAEWGRLVLTRDGIVDYSQISRLRPVDPDEIISAEELGQIRDCVRYLRGEELGILMEQVCQRAGRLNNGHPDGIRSAFFRLENALQTDIDDGERSAHFAEQYFYAYANAPSYRKVFGNVYEMLARYIDEQRNRAMEKKGRPITQALLWIRAHFSEPVSLEDAASSINVSSKYLSRLFREEMDMSFTEYLTQIRMEEAEKLLAQTNLPIREIAQQVGYADEKYFSKLYKKQTGMKPSEYRKVYGV